MNKSRLTLAATALALTLPLLQGCFPAIVAGTAAGVMSAHDRRSTGTQADDESLEWKAADAIPAKFRNAAHVNVTAYNRRLLLTGEVPGDEARSEIEAAARGLQGVREVYNELVVAAPSSLSVRSRDSFVTSKVKARLVDSQKISANHVKVVTENGHTYLMGIVSAYEGKVAVQVARTTDGVRKVVNVLEVLPDADIKRLDLAPAGAQRPAPVESR